jgi:CubicO group peptidase (beta-lactamase class C family)
MTSYFKFLLLAISSYFFLINSDVYAQSPKSEEVQNLFEDYIGKEMPGLSIMVLKDDEIVFMKSYGFEDIKNKKKADSNTKYDVVGLTRQFTSMGIFLLEEEGKLSLKDKVADIIDLPSYARGITINHLLTQTSGLPSYKDDIYNISNKDILKFLHGKDSLLFKTSSRAQINPVNYALLALIIEEKSGLSFSDFMEENIFFPLNMENSEVYTGEGWFNKMKNKALPYSFNSETEKYEKIKDTPGKYYLKGVTGIFVTLKDMKKWIKAWKSDVLVNGSNLNKAKRIVYFRNSKYFWGYGWRKGFEGGRKYLFNGTAGKGNISFALMHPGKKMEVVVLSNHPAIFGLKNKGFRLIDLFSEEE